MTTLRVTVYGIWCNGRFVTAYQTKQEAETVAARIVGYCQIIPLTGKIEERT